MYSKTSYSSHIMIRPNKLECYRTIGCSGLPLKTLDLIGPFANYVKKFNVVNMNPGAVFKTLHNLLYDTII
jgi:hypothetical protein